MQNRFRSGKGQQIIQGSQQNMTLDVTFASINVSSAVLNQIKLINIEILIVYNMIIF